MTINTKKPETPEEKAHELMRRELWMKTAISAAHENSSNDYKIIQTAKVVLEAFDSKFPQPI